MPDHCFLSCRYLWPTTRIENWLPISLLGFQSLNQTKNDDGDGRLTQELCIPSPRASVLAAYMVGEKVDAEGRVMK